jgi:hypothetical protein
MKKKKYMIKAFKTGDHPKILLKKLCKLTQFDHIAPCKLWYGVKGAGDKGAEIPK